MSGFEVMDGGAPEVTPRLQETKKKKSPVWIGIKV